MAGRLQKIKPIVARTVLADDEKVIGRHSTGQEIIERTYMKTFAEDVLDKEGNEVWKTNHLGIPISQVRRKVLREVTEVYVYEDVGGGHNFKNFDFRAPPEVLAERARIEGIQKLKDEYFERAYDRGMSADEILDIEEAGGVVPEVENDDEVAPINLELSEEEQEAQAAAEQAIAEAEKRDRKAMAEQRNKRARKRRAEKSRGKETAGV